MNVEETCMSQDRQAAAGSGDGRGEARALLDERGWSLAEAAARIGVSDSTLSLWLRGEYKGNTGRVGQLVRRWLDTERDVSALRAAGLDRHADLAVTERIERAARHAQANADVVVVFGAAGGGKTWALRHYCAASTGAWYAAMSPAATTPAAVLARIARALGVGPGPASAARLEQAVVDRLATGPALLAVDEAHHLTQALLDVVRCVHDAAACGLVLSGNEPLWARLAGGERAAQLVSRVGLTCRLRRPAAGDVVALAAALLEEPPQGKARAALLAAAGRVGGLRAVRKLAGQAHLLAAADGRRSPSADDVVDAAELLGAAP